MSKLLLVANDFFRTSLNLPTRRNRKPRPSDPTPISALPSETLVHIFGLAHDPEDPYTMLAVALVCRAWRAPAQRVLSDDIVVPTHFKTVPGGPDFFHRIYNGKKWKRDPVVLWEEYTEVCERGTSAFAPPLRAKVRAMDFYRDIDFHTDLTLLDKHSPEFRCWKHSIVGIPMIGSPGLVTNPFAYPPRLTTLRLLGTNVTFLRFFLALYGAAQKIKVLEIIDNLTTVDLGTYSSIVAPLVPTLRRLSLGLGSYIRYRGLSHLLETLQVPTSLSIHYRGNVSSVQEPIWIFDGTQVLPTVHSITIVKNLAIKTDKDHGRHRILTSLEQLIAGSRLPSLERVDLDFRRGEVERDGEGLVKGCAGRGIRLRCWEDLL